MISPSPGKSIPLHGPRSGPISQSIRVGVWERPAIASCALRDTFFSHPAPDDPGLPETLAHRAQAAEAIRGRTTWRNRRLRKPQLGPWAETVGTNHGERATLGDRILCPTGHLFQPSCARWPRPPGNLGSRRARRYARLRKPQLGPWAETVGTNHGERAILGDRILCPTGHLFRPSCAR